MPFCSVSILTRCMRIKDLSCNHADGGGATTAGDGHDIHAGGEIGLHHLWRAVGHNGAAPDERAGDGIYHAADGLAGAADDDFGVADHGVVEQTDLKRAVGGDVLDSGRGAAGAELRGLAVIGVVAGHGVGAVVVAAVVGEAFEAHLEEGGRCGGNAYPLAGGAGGGACRGGEAILYAAGAHIVGAGIGIALKLGVVAGDCRRQGADLRLEVDAGVAREDADPLAVVFVIVALVIGAELV